MQRGGSVYIMATLNNYVLYTGVTSNLFSRVQQHKLKIYPKSFTAKYGCTKLVYHESYSRIEEAIAVEKRIKAGSRESKKALIEVKNPNWKDLFEELEP